MPNKLTYSQLLQRIEGLENDVKALNEGNERLNLAFEATDDGLWELDPRTGKAYFSPRWHTMLGYEPGELPASYETWTKLLHPDDRQYAEDAVKSYLNSRDHFYSIEFRMRTKSGHWRWIHSRGKAFGKDDKERFSRMIGTHVDITERKEMENQLRLTQLAFDQASVGIFRIGPDGQIQKVNDRACESLGYSKDELCQMTVFDIDPSFSQETFKEYRRDLRRNPFATFETVHIRKDGSVFPVIITVNYHEFEGEQFTITFQTDITALKRAEESLRKSDERIKSIFRASPAGIGLVSNRRILEVNDRFCEMTGYSVEELIGQDASMLYPTIEEYEYVGEEKYNQIKRHGTGTVETHIKRKDGEIMNVLLISSPMDSTNLSAGVTFTVLDITAKIQAEKEKAKLESQFRQAQKVEAIGQLAGGVAHDLNNLLSPIMGYSELLLAATPLNDAKRRSLEQILKASMGARDLVSQLLAFSRKQTLEYIPLNLNHVIANFEKLLRRTIREDIAINIVPSSYLLPVMADIGQIEQVIMNLTVNAADSMPDGGLLTIETLVVEMEQFSANDPPDMKPGKYVMMAFSDTGHGMDEKTCERIFEPFFSTKGIRGTGLGLATVYGIIRQHNGNIWVYSELGKGTTFKVYLPVSIKENIDCTYTEKAARDLMGTETIMLVEDNEEVRNIAYEILKQHGYKVLSAKSGKEAQKIQASHRDKVHLLLTDVIMPDLNGKEVYTRIASKYPGLKVLYMSGYTNNVIAHHGVLEEGVQFIQKPFTAQALALKVREVLEN